MATDDKDKIKEDKPADKVKKWTDEFAAARGSGVNKFHKAGDKIIKLYLMENGVRDDRIIDEETGLFHANIQTIMDMMYGQLPKVEVDRTFGDAQDDVARVAAEMAERILNQDVQAPGRDYNTLVRSSLSDRLLPGLGCARVRYNMRTKKTPVPGVPAMLHPATGQEMAPAVPPSEKEEIDYEAAEEIYVHWKDFLWSPARTHAEIRWKAFRSYMTKEEVEERFDSKIADALAYNSKGPMEQKNSSSSKDPSSLRQTAPQTEIWEIWEYKDKKVFWFNENYKQGLLDEQDDPLELEGFWPDPPPMIANTTTTRYVPKSDYSMAQDLYISVDVLENRIARLTEACKLVGVYDKANDEVKRMFNESIENQLIPVDNWAVFTEKGGLEGVIQWLPIKEVADVITELTTQQDRKKQQLYEVTGMSDIMRGAAQQPYTSAEETKTKTKFASIRVQRLQNDLSEWVANLQKLKLQIICKFFQPETIIKLSNVMMTPDAQFAQQAVQFLKSDKWSCLRIKVQSDSMALADYQQMQADRTNYMMAVSQFMQSSAPLAEQDADVVPFLMQLLQWGLAGFKGSQQIEGVMDQAIRTFQKKAQQQPAGGKPDPKLQAIQAESQAKIEIMQQQAQIDQQGQQQKQQMELERAQADHAAQMQKMQNDQALEQQKFENQMEILKATLVVNLAKLTAQQQADTSAKAVDMIHHVEQTSIDAKADTHKATLDAAVDTAKAENTKDVAAHATKQAKEQATHAAKVQVQSSDKGNGGND